MANTADTLLYPFERQFLSLPDGARVAWLNAQLPDNRSTLDDDWRAALVCEQVERGAFLALTKEGLSASPALQEDNADYTLILAGKHRRANETLIARAVGMTKADGMILVAGGKTDGIQSLRKTIAKYTPIGDVISKFHAQVVWFSPDVALAQALAHQDQPYAHQQIAAPGMFSHDRIDKASALLATHFDDRLTGAVADFGCGWGYLAQQVLARGQPASLDLFEAHHPSLMAAQQNLSGATIEVNGHWIDLTLEVVPRRYDAIVMNPPFHAGRQTQRSLGEAFIKSASKALKPGGRLLMVANTGLAYEPTLESCFARFDEIDRADGFKVLSARR
ncbi:MAG: class I SAM-dependent methyltransferase [Ahrensia sp.]